MEDNAKIMEKMFPDLKYFGLLTDKVIDQEKFDSYSSRKMTNIYSRAERMLTKFLFEFS